VPLGLVILKNGETCDETELQSQLVEKVRDHIGPVACFKTAIVVDRLPKTRSGKILRKLIRQSLTAKPLPCLLPSKIRPVSLK
jgi:propionyl-CoA synthetase